jgi:hypothetical protein
MIYSQRSEDRQNYKENRSSPPFHDRKAARQPMKAAAACPLFTRRFHSVLSRTRLHMPVKACVFGLRSLTLACLLAKTEKHLSLSCFPIPIYCEGTLGSLQFPCQAVYSRRSRGVAQFIAPLSSFVKRFPQTSASTQCRRMNAEIPQTVS